MSQQDNVVMYFAGHGLYDFENKIGFLAPVEGIKDKDWSLIYNSTIRQYIEGYTAHHVFLVVDSCFSGDLILRSRGEKRGAIEAYAQRVGAKPSRWGLAAGRIEKVADGMIGNHSPFNRALVNFLKNPPSTQFAVSELINEVSKITTYNADQTPIGGILNKTGHLGGEFVFRKKLDEEGVWKKVTKEQELKGYENYLLQFPSGIYREEAIWTMAGLLGTAEGFGRYIALFPGGKYIEEAAWGRAKVWESVEAYLNYRRTYPGGKYYEEALKKMRILEEEEDWKQATRRNSISFFEEYLGKYSNGKYKEEAYQKIEKLLQ